MALNEELNYQGDFLFKHRSYFPLILVFFGVLVKLCSVSKVSNIDQIDGILNAETIYSIAIFLGLTGCIIRVLAIGFAPENTSGRNTKVGQVADQLNTLGLYSITRNPLYLVNYLMWLSICIITGSFWFVLVFSFIFWIYYERIIYAEESFLRKKFGNEFLGWASVTPIFIPLKFQFKRPVSNFNWRKVVGNEKNGVFALFFLLWIFHSISDLISGNYQGVFSNLYFYLALIFGIMYFNIKILKNYTRILDVN